MSPHMSPPMSLSKLEHVMILHLHDPVYLRLIHLLSQTEMYDDISRAKVTLMLGRSGLLDLTDEIEHVQDNQTPHFHWNQLAWSHLRHV